MRQFTSYCKLYNEKASTVQTVLNIFNKDLKTLYQCFSGFSLRYTKYICYIIFVHFPIHWLSTIVNKCFHKNFHRPWNNHNFFPLSIKILSYLRIYYWKLLKYIYSDPFWNYSITNGKEKMKDHSILHNYVI